jgi:hypothetical protein
MGYPVSDRIVWEIARMIIEDPTSDDLAIVREELIAQEGRRRLAASLTLQANWRPR